MFSRIVGQDQALKVLKSALASARLPNAYLFVGAPGIGKFKAAMALAMAANCRSQSDGGLFADDPQAEPGGFPTEACGECASCRKIVGSNHPDVRVISKSLRSAQEGKRIRDLTIEQVRPLLAEMAYSAYEGRRRVIIFDGAHDLNESAQNALLKSLEEPPDDTTFILVTDQRDRLLPTVISRARIVRFSPISAQVAAPLIAAELDLTEPEAAILASAVGGSLGRALGEHSGLYSQEARAGIITDALESRSHRAVLQTAEDWTGHPEELPIRLEILANFYRDACVVASGIGDEALLVHRDLASMAREIDLDPEGLDECFQVVGNARHELARAAQDPRLVLEHMFLELAAVG